MGDGNPTWIPGSPAGRGIRAAAAAVALGAAFLAGCGAAADGSERGASDEAFEGELATGQTETKIIGGAVDQGTSSQDAVVALRLGAQGLCTGALVAPNLVLTARHCVSQTRGPQVDCDEKGRSANGDHLAADRSPSTIAVFLGARPNLGGPAAAIGRAVVHPAGNVLCNSDIALLVLDRDITSVAPLAVRTQSAIVAGETVRAVGYGENNSNLPLGTRLARPGVTVRAVGSRITASNTKLANREFEVGQSICQGDSGGPAISETTGAVVGVVSRGGECNSDFGQVYTSTAGFEDLFRDAQAAAGTTVADEGGALVGSGPVAASEDDSASGQSRGAKSGKGSGTDDGFLGSSPGSAGCSVRGAGSGSVPGGGPGAGGAGLAAAFLAALRFRRRTTRATRP